ncbi:MAG TPA: benzoate-CoA ligase family protein [Roseiarcus sp.]|nr:benzoate-CoA ligase family protein [Roseiarcus sp.]
MGESSVANACADLVDRNIAQGRADKPAFLSADRTLTYGALQAETCRFARLLNRLDLRREDRIALAMLDTVDFPIAFLGAIRFGVVPIPLNTLLVAEQYAYMLADSRAKALVVSSALWPTLEPVLAKAPDLRHVIFADGAAPKGAIALREALAAESDAMILARTHPDEPCFWLYSSGSTGAPKGVRHIHSSMSVTAATFARQVLQIRESDVVYSAAKLFFAYGLGNSLSFPLSVGASAYLLAGRPTPAAVFDTLEKSEATIFCGVPTLFAAMLHDRAHAERRGSPRLRICTSAGEALPEHIGKAWRARFGVDILDGVGTTEMLHIFLANAPDDIVYGTSGKAVPGYDLRLLDENMQPTPVGEIGELYVRGESAGDGYWNQRAKSRATFLGEWTRTGDKFICDADGRFTYCGRADDMFKVGGVWVSPFEVEASLAGHAAVLEAAVVPAEDADKLLKPKAYVVLKDGATREGLDETLKAHVKANIGVWKYPRWIEIVDSLPKTATGKIQRFKLRERG